MNNSSITIETPTCVSKLCTVRSKHTGVVHEAVSDVYEERAGGRQPQSPADQEGAKMYPTAAKRLVILLFWVVDVL